MGKHKSAHHILKTFSMRVFLVLTCFIFFIGCTDKYAKYKKTPSYIAEASAAKKAYYDAYDETLALWDVPYEELYIPTTNGIAHVIVSGPKNAEPVVLLHGMNASATMWYPNIGALTKNHRVFAIDFILEPGKSHLYNDIESIEKVIDWYNEILFVLELDSFHLIGASRGGWLAVHLALNNQKRIKSMILLSPAQTFTWIKLSPDLFESIIALFSSKETQNGQTLKSMTSNMANIRDAYLKQYNLGRALESKNKFITSMKPFSNKELESLQMPVLVLIGDEDIINGRRTVELADELPNGKGEVISGAGHFLSMDQAEMVNEKMVNFLKNGF